MSNKTGFTLFELLIVLMISIIFIGFALPSLRFLLDKTDSDHYRERLLRAMQLTRSEAIMRSELVTLCPSRDQNVCSGEWQDGYIIFSETDKLFTFKNTTSGKIHWRSFPQDRQFLRFLPSGFPDAENGTFWYCRTAQNPLWAIIVNNAGRARTVLPDQAGKIIDDKGKPLTCG